MRGLQGYYCLMLEVSLRDRDRKEQKATHRDADASELAVDGDRRLRRACCLADPGL